MMFLPLEKTLILHIGRYTYDVHFEEGGVRQNKALLDVGEGGGFAA